MRAAYYEVFGGPENLRIDQQPDPLPDAEHMLVRTHAAGAGIWDVAIMRGRLGEVSLPRIPGSEIAGTVEVAAGGFSVGDRVFCFLWQSGDAGVPDPRGGFAEIAAARVDSAAALPDSLDFPEAAGLVNSGATAYEGLVDRAKLQAGETVLITAASGGVGTAAVQIARDLGARVFAVASARNHGYVRDLGAEVAVDYHDPGFVQQLESAGPNGFDVLFDGTGNEIADRVAGLVRDGGRGIFIAGAPRPVTESSSSLSGSRSTPPGWRRSRSSLRTASCACPSRQSSLLTERARRWSRSARGTRWVGSCCGLGLDGSDPPGRTGQPNGSRTAAQVDVPKYRRPGGGARRPIPCAMPKLAHGR